ncbi:MAG: hypothetical protein V1772_07605 [Chloroflexota bacterium]
MPQEGNIQIDRTAQVHPSAILEGNVTIGSFTRVGAGTVITGNVTIGHHCIIECNVVIRGRNNIGDWVHIYDLVNIEGGRPGQHLGGVTSAEPDQSVIGDRCWINHGATMHGCQLADDAVLGLNACLDYNCRIGRGALICNGTALPYNTVIPANCLVDGVPGQIVRRDITDDDRRERMGLVPAEWVKYAGEQLEQRIRAKLGMG